MRGAGAFMLVVLTGGGVPLLSNTAHAQEADAGATQQSLNEKPTHAASVSPAVAAWADGTTDADDAGDRREPFAADTVARLTWTFQRLILSGHENARNQALAALRDLHDPELAGLFAQGASSDDALLRTHSILALAELDARREGTGTAAGGLDMLLVRRLQSPREQAAVLGQAIDAGLLAPADAADAACWPDLEPRLRVALARQARVTSPAGEDHAVQPSVLAPIAKGSDLVAAVSAEWELRASGGAHEVGMGDASPAVDRLMKLTPGARREELAMQLLRYAKDNRIGPARVLAQRVIADERSSELLRYAAVSTLVHIAGRDAHVREAWLDEMRRCEGDAAGRARLSVALLGAWIESPNLAGRMNGPIVQRLLGDDSPLVRGVGRAAGSIDDPPTLARQLGELTELGQASCARWLVEVCARTGKKALTPEQKRAALAHVVEAAARHGRDDATLYEIVSDAAALPEAELSAWLERAAEGGGSERQGDEALAVAVLAGAMRRAGEEGAGSVDAPLGVPFAGLPGGERGVPSAMLVVLEGGARLNLRTGAAAAGRDAGTSELFTALAAVANKPSIPESVRASAAWLALRAAGEARGALVRVVAHVEPFE